MKNIMLILSLMILGAYSSMSQTPTLPEKIYVIDRKWANAYEKPSFTSPKIGICEYGSILSILKEEQDWWLVESSIPEIGWTKVYISKNATGNLNQIKLLKEDLNTVLWLTENSNTKQAEEGFPLNKYIDLELVSKEEFEAQQRTAIDYFKADTITFKKKNGVIALKCGENIKQIKDKGEEEDMETYTYVGEIPVLNKYVVSGMHWEAWDYTLIDKTTGEETKYLLDFPYLSANKKHIICITPNGYEPVSGNLELHEVKNGEIKHKFTVGFKNWMPTMEPDIVAFWGANGCCYMPIIHITNMYAGNDERAKPQYLKIKLRENE